MKFAYAQAELTKLWKQRNFATVMAGGLMVSNLILGLATMGREDQWVLIPQFDAGERIPVSKSSLSKSYLERWSTSLVQDLMTANPASVDLKIQRFLAVSSSAFGSLEQKLRTQAKKLKREGISTVFYPKEVAFEKNAVRVSGTFMTYFGRDKAPIASFKTYKLSYTRARHGVVVATDLQEIKK